ncbi:hypothetical protein [Paenibacillus sp. UASWS1643]|uniref:hypothetical protein n=1 Tax=Paenibacillus sp. UASWS1643 TaxID=2580422 RepID=UPI00123852DD|nr:hypothetical protein [Paenibacillus sp. UASWS1643]KAA8750044.1 hypothetical protein FE296_15715 [Paenibacillus sp. UASWS1643]
MTTVMVTQEQSEGVKTLLTTMSRETILNKHTEAKAKGMTKFWGIAGLNDLSNEKMALLLYNPDKVTVEPSLEDNLRDAYIGAKSQDFADGLVKAATLYGINPSMFEGLVEWVPDDNEPAIEPDQQ